MSQTLNPTATTPKKRNHFISYIKGYAIIAVILIHLIDWSNIGVPPLANWLKELLYPGVFFFMACSGSVVYIAYARSETWVKPAKKLVWRGLQLIGVYYLYNIIKLFVYDFSKEPFYWQYTDHGLMTLKNILLLKIFSAPISILLTIGAMIILSPLLLAITKKIKFPNLVISFLLASIMAAVYCFEWSGPVADFLFARNIVMFPMAYWSIPFIMGYLLAAFGFEERKGLWVAIFTILMSAFTFYNVKNGLSLHPSAYMYPLRVFYPVASLFFVSLIFYIFYWSEKIPFSLVKKKLAIIRFLGDDTLSIYIWHWLVIDMTLWVLSPSSIAIWITVPTFLVIYLFIKRKKLQEYFLNQV